MSKEWCGTRMLTGHIRRKYMTHRALGNAKRVQEKVKAVKWAKNTSKHQKVIESNMRSSPFLPNKKGKVGTPDRKTKAAPGRKQDRRSYVCAE